MEKDNSGYLFEGEDMFSALLEMNIKILASNLAMISLICDKNSSTVEESNNLFKDVQMESAEYALEILRDLYARKGKIDVSGIIDKKTP